MISQQEDAMSSNDEEQENSFDTESPDDFDSENMTLENRILLLQQKEIDVSFQNKPSTRKLNKVQKTGKLAKVGRSHKNAPAEMMSNRPVRRLRDVADNSVKKFRDPRFSDISGKLDHDKFLQSYEFLEEHQENEIKTLEKSTKKIKGKESLDLLKEHVDREKQQMVERRRYLKVRQRLSSLKAEEQEKVKNGKKPYFLTKAAKKTVALEERFDELKKDGKLQKFLSKKRKHNASKDHLAMPTRRQKYDED